MTDVFICYSRRDLEFVRSLAEALRERAADTFLDLGEWWYDDVSREQSAGSGDVSAMGSPGVVAGHPASDSAVASANRTGLEAGYKLNAGARMDEVHAAIRGATSVLAVVSPDLAASARCRHEIERAAALHKHIVAVSARPTPTPSLPPQLRQCELVALPADDLENGLGRLVRALEGDSPRISVWASLHRRRWTLLGIMALLFLGLAYGATRTFTRGFPFVDRLYVAIALFRDNTTIYSQSAAKVPPVPMAARGRPLVRPAHPCPRRPVGYLRRAGGAFQQAAHPRPLQTAPGRLWTRGLRPAFGLGLPSHVASASSPWTRIRPPWPSRAAGNSPFPCWSATRRTRGAPPSWSRAGHTHRGRVRRQQRQRQNRRGGEEGRDIEQAPPESTPAARVLRARR